MGFVGEQSVFDSERMAGKCYLWHEYDYWVSIYGKAFCGYCHPPASEKLILYRVRNEKEYEQSKKYLLTKEKSIYKINGENEK